MKVRELIDLLSRCDSEVEVVNNDYEDVYCVREETVYTYRDDKRHCTSHIVLEFKGDC